MHRVLDFATTAWPEPAARNAMPCDGRLTEFPMFARAAMLTPNAYGLLDIEATVTSTWR